MFNIACLDAIYTIDLYYVSVFMWLCLGYVILVRVATYLVLAYKIAKFEERVSDDFKIGREVTQVVVKEWVEHMVQMVNYRLFMFVPLFPREVRNAFRFNLDMLIRKEHVSASDILDEIRYSRTNLSCIVPSFLALFLKVFEKRMLGDSMKSVETNRVYVMHLLDVLKDECRFLKRTENYNVSDMDAISKRYSYIKERSYDAFRDYDTVNLISREMQASTLCISDRY